MDKRERFSQKIVEHVAKLRRLANEHSLLMRNGHAYSERLTEIEEEIERMQREADKWSDYENRLYMEIFPKIPKS